jgi:ketosteroid isomerase-like protein
MYLCASLTLKNVGGDVVSKMWTMRDGKQIAIRDMTDSHIKNAMRMLERSAKERLEEECFATMGFASMVQGDMASMMIDMELDALFALSEEDYLYEYTAYGELEKELGRRKKAGELVDMKVSATLLKQWVEKQEGVLTR